MTPLLTGTYRAERPSAPEAERPNVPSLGTVSGRSRDVLAEPGPGGGIPTQRIESLCDPGSFRPIRSAVESPGARRSQPGDGVLAGSATIAARPVFVYAQDPAFLGGSLGERHAETIVRVLRLARESGVPAIGLVQSGGARMDEGAAGLEGYGRIFREHVASSGWIPQVSVIYGTSAGGGCYSPALTDLVVMCEEATMFLTGPQVVAEALGEEVTKEDLGGPRVHGANGVAQLVAPGEQAAAHAVHSFLSYLPSNRGESPPRRDPCPAGDGDPGLHVPAEARKVYDVGAVSRAIADEGSELELAPRWAPNLYTAFVRIEGRPVGVIANQPKHLAGVLNAAAAEKGAWFVELCDRFGLPLLTLVDTPGFLPGSREESRGVIRLGAGLVRAFASAQVPKVTLVLRKAFGGAYITMNSRALGADMSFAWPGAQVGVMAGTQAVGIVNRRELVKAPDPDALRAELAAEYAERHTRVSVAAAAGIVEEVVDPSQTRDRVSAAFAALGSRRRQRWAA